MPEVLITGGAGFIGSNLAQRLLRRGLQVRVLDDLSKPGSRENLLWLRQEFPGKQLFFIEADINDRESLESAVAGVGRIYHLAGQTAVTTSLLDPIGDFRANAAGTLAVLEAARHSGSNPVFLYASTNKVYGAMEKVRLEEQADRYVMPDFPEGIGEAFPLEFNSPYGCSKGAGDQYTLDYHRVYGLRTVVLRQSCVFGPRQFGRSDHGWLAWFASAAVRNLPIEICGDGRQVRDVLYIDDLLDAYDLVIENIDATGGEAFNVGGGPGNAISVWSDFQVILEEILGRKLSARFTAWRPGDQRVYVSDCGKIRRLLGWRPSIGVREGVRRLVSWVEQHEVAVRP